MVIKLTNLGGNLSNLPSLEPVLGVEDLPVLLLKLPKFCIYIKCSAKIGLPLLVTILREVPGKKGSER